MTERILLVLGSSAGGVGTHVKSIAVEFVEAGHDVHVAGPAAANELFGFSSMTGVRYSPLEIPARLSLTDSAGVVRLRALIADAEPDIVHAHGFRAALLAVLARRVLTASRGHRPGYRLAHRLAHRPAYRPVLVTTWHNAVLGSGPRARLQAVVERFLARSADLTLGASQDLVDRAATLGAPGPQLMPVAAPASVRASKPGAVPDESARADAGDLAGADVGGEGIRAELRLRDDDALVLTVGRIAPQKNYALLCDAVARVRSTHAAFAIAGGADPDELTKLESRIAAGHLPIELLGPRDDVASLYDAADLFVLTSRWEARALVVQEAMAFGLPVVATAVGGLPELIGDAGILVDAGAVAAAQGTAVEEPVAAELAAAITSLVDDPSKRRELGERARRRAAEFPDETEVARRLLACYRELLARRPD